MQCASDYEVTDSNLYTEGTSDNITAFTLEGSEDVLTQNEELREDSDTTENPTTTATSTVTNLANAVDSVHNLIMFASEVGDKDCTVCSTFISCMHSEVQLSKKKTHQTKISDFFSV